MDTFSVARDKQSCVVEFSAYDCAVGDTAGNNTVFWEVRNY